MRPVSRSDLDRRQLRRRSGEPGRQLRQRSGGTWAACSGWIVDKLNDFWRLYAAGGHYTTQRPRSAALYTRSISAAIRGNLGGSSGGLLRLDPGRQLRRPAPAEPWQPAARSDLDRRQLRQRSGGTWAACSGSLLRLDPGNRQSVPIWTGGSSGGDPGNLGGSSGSLLRLDPGNRQPRPRSGPMRYAQRGALDHAYARAQEATPTGLPLSRNALRLRIYATPPTRALDATPTGLLLSRDATRPRATARAPARLRIRSRCA